MKFSELQNLVKEKFGIDHLADIARELGVSPQSVSNWKARDRVPYKYVIKIRRQFKESDTQVSGQSETNAANDSNQVLSQYGYPQHFEKDTISIPDILLVLARQIKIIIIMPIILCILTIIHVLFFADSVYESTAKIMSSSGGSGVSQAAGIAAQFGINIPMGQSEPVWVYPEVIKSRTLARGMLKRKFDTQKYGPKKPLLQILTYGNQEPTVGLDNLIKGGVNSFIGMIDIQAYGSFYNLTISAPEPVFARDIAIALIEELEAHQRRYNKAKTSETRQFIEERIIDTRKELEAIEEALKDFNVSNRRIENSPALKLERQRLAREVSVLTGVFTTLKQSLETTKIEEVKDSDYVVVLDPPEAPLQRSKPNSKRMVVLAGILGIGLGIAIGFVKDYSENIDVVEQEKIGNIKSLVLKNINDFLPRRFKKN